MNDTSYLMLKSEETNLRLEVLEAKSKGQNPRDVRSELAEIQKKLSAREQSKSISDGETPPQHIGKRSQEVVQQEINSHEQNFQETFNQSEKDKWLNKKKLLEKELQEILMHR